MSGAEATIFLVPVLEPRHNPAFLTGTHAGLPSSSSSQGFRSMRCVPCTGSLSGCADTLTDRLVKLDVAYNHGSQEKQSNITKTPDTPWRVFKPLCGCFTRAHPVCAFSDGELTGMVPRFGDVGEGASQASLRDRILRKARFRKHFI